MKYHKLSYIEKLEQLQAHFQYSTKLAEAIGVSRRSLPNWYDNPESIKAEHKLDIDVLYCKHFLIPEWDNAKDKLRDKSGQIFKPVLLPDSMQTKPALFMPLLRKLSYGTMEIETDISREDFDKVLDEKRLPKNIDRQTFHATINSFFTHQWLWNKIVTHQEDFSINEDSIKSLHADFMRGVHADAGFYSDKIRVLGKLENLQTTLPEDIPEEMHRWIFKSNKVETLDDIACAHAYFIAIHPFGDGNGRVGRALVLAQCLMARLMPPILDGENRAMYFAAMEHALLHGRYIPLIRLFYEAAAR